MSKVFGGMAASLDGYVQSTSGDLSWLNNTMKPGEDYGFEQTMKRTGAYIIGASTYREILKLGMPLGIETVPCYVMTHNKGLKTDEYTHLYSGDPRRLVEKIKLAIDENKDICVFGGGDVITQFIELDLLDELGLSIVPVILGDGIPFFRKLTEMKHLELVECKPYESGIVILQYRLVKQ